MKNTVINELLASFNEISGMEIYLMDTQMRVLGFSRKRSSRLCALLHESPAAIETCRASDKELFELAREAEGAVRFTCPFGMSELILPIERDGERIGYIFCTVGLTEDGESTEALVQRLCTALPELAPEFGEELARTAVLDGKRVDALERIVRLIANHIAERDLLSQSSSTLGSLIKAYVRDNYTKRITLADIGYCLHCSTVTLTEHFRREYGITIMQYVNELRLRAAANELATTDLSVKQIALRSGFSEVDYFSRCFRKKHGVTPTEYRARSREK